MTRLRLVGSTLLICGSLTTPVWSQEDAKGENGRPLFERLVKEFDRDGDGELNQQERAMAVRVTEQLLGRLKERGPGDFAEALKRFDKDGDGKLNDEERAAAMKARSGQTKDGPPGMNWNDPPPFVVNRFDKDGDGKLNDEEKGAAREAMAKMARDGGIPSREEMVKRFDKDGDGKLSESEQAAAREEFAKRAGRPGGFPPREEIIKRFDKDGDGKLNQDEEAAARAEMERRRGAGGPQSGLAPGEGKPAEAKVNQEELIKKFDRDGDGKLSQEEKAAAREAFQKRDRKP